VTANHCGSCTACCRVFAIPQLDKKAGDWCKHCDIGKGCKIYADRPQMCQDYACLWLISQEREPGQGRLGPELRPDRCKVVITPTTNPNVMGAIPTIPGAWRKGKAWELIERMALNGIAVVIGPPITTRKTLVRKINGRIIEKEVTMTPPDENGMQWSIESDGPP